MLNSSSLDDAAAASPLYLTLYRVPSNIAIHAIGFIGTPTIAIYCMKSTSQLILYFVHKNFLFIKCAIWKIKGAFSVG